ncbi:N-acyl-D-amino-acid deacylase family protein [Breznakiella homolactica]|uniref:Amidohydrolase family protein n=1 Tax=Breznakiella homolactica TaxID=2798577 RepID=A0A7T7XLC6_9SPIR|nr:amidohydrolase family protein [Breznakiella homolactica]QQO08491.1 amidohydrolase family protein [Breznakiella homolactica]
MKTLVRGGTVYDGTGAESFTADVLIEDGIITAVEPGISADSAEIIEAAGYAVTPGFIDGHRHCDIAPLTRDDFGDAELAQGITATVAGNCGLAPVPSSETSRLEMYDFLEPVTGPIPREISFGSYSEYKTAIAKAGLPLHMGFMAGAGAIKTAVKGFVSSPYTAEEITKAAAYVDEAMQAGALGVSLGIMYQPEIFSTAEEIAAVIRPAAPYNGILCTHIRGEGDSLAESVQEVIRIAAMAEMRLNVSHFKATGIRNWRSTIYRAIECIEDARAKGQPVTADFYPYDGGSSTMLSLVPPTVLADGNKAMLERLLTPEGKKHLVREIYRDHPGWDNMVTSIGWDRILISSVTLPEHAAYSGKTVSKLADELGYSDPAEFAAELLAAEHGKTGVIVLSMAQEDIDDIARLPWTALISDALYGGGDNPHPRHYGAFPKFLREYVMERRILSMEAAVHKMTAMTADRMGIRNRGRIQPGFRGDVLVFNPDKFTDTATYTVPKKLSRGMEWVLLEGRTVWHGEKQNGKKEGKILSL